MAFKLYEKIPNKPVELSDSTAYLKVLTVSNLNSTRASFSLVDTFLN